MPTANFISIFIISGLFISIIVFLYFRNTTIKATNLLNKQFENLAQHLNLNLSFTLIRGFKYPVLSGKHLKRIVTIERTIKEHYNFFVLKVDLIHPSSYGLQIIPKNNDSSNKIFIDHWSHLNEVDKALLNQKFSFFSEDPKKAAKLIEKSFMVFVKKYTQILPLFNTLIVQPTYIMLVLHSGSVRIKNELLIIEMLHYLSNLADFIEEDLK